MKRLVRSAQNATAPAQRVRQRGGGGQQPVRIPASAPTHSLTRRRAITQPYTRTVPNRVRAPRHDPEGHTDGIRVVHVHVPSIGRRGAIGTTEQAGCSVHPSGRGAPPWHLATKAGRLLRGVPSSPSRSALGAPAARRPERPAPRRLVSGAQHRCGDGVVLDVDNAPVRVSQDYVEFREVRPSRWTIVPHPRDADGRPAGWGESYAVCPHCAARAPVGPRSGGGAGGRGGPKRCTRCEQSFEVAWEEDYLRAQRGTSCPGRESNSHGVAPNGS